VSRRKRTRGHKLPPGKFVAVPIDTLKQALHLLKPSEFRTFVALAAQSQPWSNGTACVTLSVIREYRLGSTRSVTSAIRKLVEAGMIRQTRRPRQHIAARYGMTHLPLNEDAMAKMGFSATTLEALDEHSSNSDSSLAAARPRGKRYRDHVGSAEPPEPGPARPRGKRTGPFSWVSARPRGTRSKTLPGTTAEKGAADDTPEAAVGGAL
jgi:hypothetical protein